jgi:hypothetical protein
MDCTAHVRWGFYFLAGLDAGCGEIVVIDIGWQLKHG